MLYNNTIRELENDFFTNWVKDYSLPRTELLEHQNSKIHDLCTLLYDKSPYYKMVFDRINITPDEIRTVDDFKQKIPLTTKEQIQTHSSKLLRTDRKINKFTVETYTTGSTGKPLRLYRFIYDFFYTANMLRNLMDVKLTKHSQIRFIIPRGSSIWNGETLFRIIFPNFRIWSPQEFDEILKKKQKGVLENIDMIFSWTRIPAALMKRYPDALVHLRPKILMIGGEILTAKTKEFYQSALPHTYILDQYATIELGWINNQCSKGNMHVLEDVFLPEIVNKNDEGHGEFVATFLYPLSMPLLRYPTGDLVKEISCDCGYTGMAIEFIGRTKYEDIHKHFERKHLINAIDASPLLHQHFLSERLGLKVVSHDTYSEFVVLVPYKANEKPSDNIIASTKQELLANINDRTQAKNSFQALFLREGVWKYRVEMVPDNEYAFIDGKIQMF